MSAITLEITEVTMESLSGWLSPQAIQIGMPLGWPVRTIRRLFEYRSNGAGVTLVIHLDNILLEAGTKRALETLLRNIERETTVTRILATFGEKKAFGFAEVLRLLQKQVA